MTENDIEWEWRRQPANLRFFRLAWGLQRAIPIPVPRWGKEPLGQPALTLMLLMPLPLLTFRQPNPIPGEATSSSNSWGESQTIDSWPLTFHICWS